MNDQTKATVTAMLAKAPEWVRTDLSAKDPSVRTRAEETLAAMIASALEAADLTPD
ncbi:DUF6771 family protein [Sphingomonas qomolangmaensis]|uniref:Uncharacterized protein n=1 Tax=Sphingomonas qomolangmaensis TaxID=2918765 RepID=A0ABY5LDC5_9SPHN|nr:DUF6771 family protein [Sphingomonas qomolangmaensis]UUL83835.1 hypothetical protein NMP03_06470 [Sphingomonas qomolangmaensis]